MTSQSEGKAAAPALADAPAGAGVSRSPTRGPAGRGRGSTTPAWKNQRLPSIPRSGDAAGDVAPAAAADGGDAQSTPAEVDRDPNKPKEPNPLDEFHAETSSSRTAIALRTEAKRRRTQGPRQRQDWNEGHDDEKAGEDDWGQDRKWDSSWKQRGYRRGGDWWSGGGRWQNDTGRGSESDWKYKDRRRQDRHQQQDEEEAQLGQEQKEEARQDQPWQQHPQKFENLTLKCAVHGLTRTFDKLMQRSDDGAWCCRPEEECTPYVGGSMGRRRPAPPPALMPRDEGAGGGTASGSRAACARDEESQHGGDGDRDSRGDRGPHSAAGEPTGRGSRDGAEKGRDSPLRRRRGEEWGGDRKSSKILGAAIRAAQRDSGKGIGRRRGGNDGEPRGHADMGGEVPAASSAPPPAAQQESRAEPGTASRDRSRRRDRSRERRRRGSADMQQAMEAQAMLMQQAAFLSHAAAMHYHQQQQAAMVASQQQAVASMSEQVSLPGDVSDLRAGDRAIDKDDL